MSRQVLMETLRKVRFLEGVAEEHLEHLAAMANIEEFEEGETLFAQDDTVDAVYLVVSGEITLEVSGSGIEPQQMLFVGPGESVGWSALIERRRRTATARVTAPTTLIRIDGQQLLELCEADPRFGFEIMRKTAGALARRLKAMRQRFLEVYRLQPVCFTSGGEEIGVD